MCQANVFLSAPINTCHEKSGKMGRAVGDQGDVRGDLSSQ